MSESLAELIVTATSTYLGAGALFAGPFVCLGVWRIDPAARHSTRGFRALILPGVVLLWPLLLIRWARGSVRPPRESTAHRRASARRAA